MTLLQPDEQLESIREPEPGTMEVTEGGRQAAREEEEQLNRDRAIEASKIRNLYSEELYRLLRYWASAVFAACIATGVRAPASAPTCPNLMAALLWATCFAIVLLCAPPLRARIARLIKHNFGYAYALFVFLAIGWAICLAECSSFVSTWKAWTPLDLVFAFELPSAVLVALAGTVTAGAVAMFVVVLRYYFTGASRKQ